MPRSPLRPSILSLAIVCVALGACITGSIGDELKGDDLGDGGSGAGTTAGPGPGGGATTGGGACGDGQCGPGESCESCSGDCGVCPPSCGNGVCDASETCVTCPSECGACPPMCGNGVCEAGEDCAGCANDCGACPPSCGNGVCDATETCMTCPSECGACPPVCGDGVCEAGETCDMCPGDCGACPTGCGGAGPTTTPLDSEEQALLGLINQHRAQNGAGPLTACTSLNRAAQGHSEDMRDNDYFSHTGLNGSSFSQRTCDACYELGCGPMTAMGENIAAGNSGAQGTFTQWVNSPGHNANMLNASYNVIGIGRAIGGGTYGSYWTNVFGGASEPSCN